MALTDTKVRTLKARDKIYRVADDQGLCIEIKPSGVKVWRYRYMINGKASMMSLGEYPAVSLADARLKRNEYRVDVLAGRDPVKVKREMQQEVEAKNKNSFEAIYLEWFEKRMGDRSDRYKDHILTSMKNDILPIIGDKPITDVTSADVLKIINNTMDRVKRENPRHKRATGECVAINNRQWIGAVIQYAIQTLRAENDPTYAVRRTIKRPPVHHARDLSKQEIIKLLEGLGAYGGTATVKNSVKFIMLTMVRSKEIRSAKWQDIDFDHALWTIDSADMKKRRTHMVPLSSQAIDILRDQQSMGSPSEYCFPSIKTHLKPISSMTINRALEYMSMDETTGHDFRATASTILNANGYNSDWIEKQLAHIDKDQTRRSYNHADYLKDRREMLQWWADYIDGLR